jgi:2,4-dienoyl-CoA reductase-like NADH-dependent reductase (Old Yellow Enzyme family)
MRKRCKFTLETVDKLCSAIGSGRVGVRLSPYGFFNETLGEQRMEQWTYLCEELAKRNIAYV